MTAKKKLKQRIRAEQEASGLRYTEARARVLASKPTRTEISELEWVTELAQGCGLRCDRAFVIVTPGVADPVQLWGAVSPEERQRRFRLAFTRLAALLHSLATDPRATVLRKALLEGTPPPSDPVAARAFSDRDLAAKLQLGLRTVSLDGKKIAFDLEVGGGTQSIMAALVSRDSLFMMKREPQPRAEIVLTLYTVESFLQAARIAPGRLGIR